jgi:hypothetical protein
MSNATETKDLVVLTADKNTQFAVRGILSRHHSLGIGKLEADFFVHPQKDPGVYHNAHDFLRFAAKTHRHALVLMDREGSGQETKTREELEEELEQELSRSGWEDRASAVVLDPEIEIWVWSDSTHVDHELGWSREPKGLRTWLREKGFLEEGSLKPERPKEAMEAALRSARKPRSSAIYQGLAEKVSLSKCQDPAFLKLKAVLQTWFSAQERPQ